MKGGKNMLPKTQTFGPGKLRDFDKKPDSLRLKHFFKPLKNS